MNKATLSDLRHEFGDVLAVSIAKYCHEIHENFLNFCHFHTANRPI